MPDVKVFLSSTTKDLHHYRDEVISAIGEAGGFMIVAMENFGAVDATPEALCRAKVETCDVYVGLIANCHGSVPDGDERSYTEIEYAVATDLGIPRLLFLSEDSFPIPGDAQNTAAGKDRQKAFRADIARTHGVARFDTTPGALGRKVANALNKWRAEHATAQPTRPASPPTSPLHQLPSDIADFKGRAADLQKLLAALDRPSGGAAAVTAIKGMGGIGKTTLAVHAARKLVARYPDAQILVNLQGHSEAPSLTPVEAMAQVVRSFNPQMPPTDDPAQMQALYRSVLEGKRALILLDNAADAAQVRDLVPPPPCGLIVTARDPIPLPGATRLELHELARPESVALLRSAADRADVTDAAWDTIAGLCGDLPLALRVAGSFLAEAIDWTAADYIRDLSDEPTRPDRLTLDSLPDTGVAAVLGLSARRLARSTPDLAARWQYLSVFPADFDPRAAAAAWDVEEDEAKRTLTALLGRSLLLFDADERRYRLHDLMRPVAARVLAVAGVEDPAPGSKERLFGATLRHAEHFLAVLRKARDLYLKGHDGVLQGLRLYDREARNITTAATWARENAAEGHPAITLANRFPNAGAYVMPLRLHQREWIIWLEAGCKAAAQLGDKQQEGIHLGNLGLACAELGETRRAIEHYEQALAISRDIGDRHGEGSDLGNLGNAYAELGETRRAIEHYEQALAIGRDIGDRRGEGHRLGNLGLAYVDLGETRRAIEHYEQALAIRRDIGDRQGEAIDLYNLGNALSKLGDRAAAVHHVEQALAIFDAIESPHAEEARQTLAAWRAEDGGGA